MDNLASFNTDHIINAYEVFGEHLAMTQRTPSVHRLHAWLISLPRAHFASAGNTPAGASGSFVDMVASAVPPRVF